ncbi:MAG: VanW family protein [Aristaeellaceae bacterium]
MYSNGYVPPTQPDRRRRSERSSAGQAPAPRQSSSRSAWEQDDWGGVHPGHQGYQPPVMPVNKPASQPGIPQQGVPSPRTAYASQRQAQPRQQDYRPQQQGYAYPEQQPRQQAYAAYQPQMDAGQAWQNAFPRYNPAGGQQQSGGRRDYPPQQPWQPTGGSGGQPPKRGGHALRTLLVIVLCVALLAGVGTGGYFALQQQQLRQYVESYDNVFCQGVYVDGIHLGGMTAEEGMAAVQAQAQQRNDAWSVRLTYQGKLVTEITASQLNMTVDVYDVLNEAWTQGHTGTLTERRDAMEALLASPYEGYTAMPGGDTSVIDSTLDSIRNYVYRAAQDASIVSFDPSRTEPFTFQEEVPGRYLDTEPVKEQLYRMVSTMESGEIALEPVAIAPQVTVADLKKTVELRASASTPISTSSTEERTNNIRRSFQLISGKVLQPGETFSFNDTVGERTEKNGFYPAIEYANGESVMGIGGGVCQASSTIYIAAVQAGLQIVKREPHSDQVNYTDYGKDATVYWQYGRKIDLQFKNNTDGPIYMVAAVQSDPSNRKRLIAKVSLYGMSLGDVTYSLETKTIEELEPGEDIIIQDKKAEYVTYTDQQYVERKARKGYVVESYRVKYMGGVEVERTLLYTDTYEARAKRIYVGVTERTP